MNTSVKILAPLVYEIFGHNKPDQRPKHYTAVELVEAELSTCDATDMEPLARLETLNLLSDRLNDWRAATTIMSVDGKAYVQTDIPKRNLPMINEHESVHYSPWVYFPDQFPRYNAYGEDSYHEELPDRQRAELEAVKHYQAGVDAFHLEKQLKEGGAFSKIPRTKITLGIDREPRLKQLLTATQRLLLSGEWLYRHVKEPCWELHTHRDEAIYVVGCFYSHWPTYWRVSDHLISVPICDTDSIPEIAAYFKKPLITDTRATIFDKAFKQQSMPSLLLTQVFNDLKRTISFDMPEPSREIVNAMLDLRDERERDDPDIDAVIEATTNLVNLVRPTPQKRFLYARNIDIIKQVFPKNSPLAKVGSPPAASPR